MSGTGAMLKKSHWQSALNWFAGHFYQTIVAPIENQFPNWPLPREIQEVVLRTERITGSISGGQYELLSLQDLLGRLGNDENHCRLLKRIMLLYRRHHAAETERLTGKTFHLELAGTLEEEIKALDAMAKEDSFSNLADVRLTRLKDYLPVQHIEAAAVSQAQFQPRQYDEKFHILQAPQLFLSDVAYYRAKCEDREIPLAVAFVDIDNFKSFNTQYTGTKIDRALLPRFMQTIEAHVYHHGYAYRQGGDEYLVLLPSISKPLATSLLDELRIKLAALSYPDIPERTTVSIGLCMAEPDCSLTDRELLNRADRASQFAKKNGKNRIASFTTSRLADEDLEIVKEPTS